MRKQEKMYVVSQKEIAYDIFELVLKGDLVATLSQPGQFVNVKTGDGALILRRPISICNIDHQKSELTLVYRATGAGTKVLSEKKAGEYVDILGPLGTGFDLDQIEMDNTVVLIGGGIGVPPLYETAKRLSARGNKVIAVLGFANVGDVFYEEKFKEFADVYVATMDGTKGFQGHVLDLIQEEGLDFDWVLGCGPHVMLNGIVTAYKGLKKGFLSFEERMACGTGACYACVKEMADESRTRVCKEGPVYDMNEVCYF
ncbi:MAG: dihydroorotate dehydrogenase electron transfer subunit [Defluviitaleaceae bacterium]|nr:dihydroorotate dehydrogenase electron transfer subunit [Defluviitaleaceae bacterium]